MDVKMLLIVFQYFDYLGAMVIVIEHDLDAIWNADDIVEMGAGGGKHGDHLQR
ncbi:MAG: hypothetical protein HFF80_06100 [Oscillospiraceae bacterium]|nr:hypothetical protein [Oscillospiraceae bacterium]